MYTTKQEKESTSHSDSAFSLTLLHSCIQPVYNRNKCPKCVSLSSPAGFLLPPFLPSAKVPLIFNKTELKQKACNKKVGKGYQSDQYEIPKYITC